jgi:hypothetical protein
MYQLHLRLSYKSRRLEEHSSKSIIIRGRLPNILRLLNRNAR